MLEEAAGGEGSFCYVIIISPCHTFSPDIVSGRLLVAFLETPMLSPLKAPCTDLNQYWFQGRVNVWSDVTQWSGSLSGDNLATLELLLLPICMIL